MYIYLYIYIISQSVVVVIYRCYLGVFVLLASSLSFPISTVLDRCYSFGLPVVVVVVVVIIKDSVDLINSFCCCYFN